MLCLRFFIVKFVFKDSLEALGGQTFAIFIYNKRFIVRTIFDTLNSNN